MSEPGWNPASEPLSDSVAGSANPPDPATNPPALAAGGPHIPIVDYGSMARSRKDEKREELGLGAIPTHDGGDDDEGESAANADLVRSRARQVMFLLYTVAHGAVVATWQAIELARRFPRASLASGLSIAILAAVMVMKPGKGEHDTTAQIKNNPPSQTAQHQQTASPPARPSGHETDSEADPDSQTPMALAAGSTVKANKGESHDNRHDNKERAHSPLLADNHASPAPGPEAGALAPAPLPAVEPVKLTGGENDLMLPPVSGPPLPEPGSQASQPAANIAANAPAPAPVFELASAEVKPGTPPETTTPAPIPAPAPAPAPATTQETPTSGRGPATPVPASGPASAPAPAPSLSPAVEPSGAPLAPVPGPGPEAREAASAAVQGASATATPASATGESAKAAVTTSGLALGTGLGAALSALGKAAVDKIQKKREAAVTASDPHVSEAPTDRSKIAPELPPVSTPASTSSPSIQSLPPPSDPPPSPPASRPAEPSSSPSQDSATTSALPPVAPAPPADFLDPHPDNATGPAHVSTPKAGSDPAPDSGSGPGSGTVSGAIPPAAASASVAASSHTNSGNDQTHEQSSSQPVGAQSTPREIAQPQPADSAAPMALKPDHQELARLGWAPVKRAGPGMVRDLQREIADNDDGLGNSDQGSAGATDPSAHADKEQSFEAEPAPFGNRAARRDASTGDTASASTTASASSQVPDKVETVLHKVERGENFWTIARLYYPSGRYYRALWKYNSGKVKAIDKLYVNTVIKIPPPEDLDPAFIDPPGTRAPRSGAENQSVNQTSRDGEATDRRLSPTEGVPVRRSSRSDPELNLPVSDPFTEQASDRRLSSRGGGRSGSPSRSVNDDYFPDRGNANNSDPGADAEPEVRSRSTVSRPVYKVRRYDTLRTIARDTLGDSRRADEVLELNRDIIDDPGHLIVGQILELPEDARVVRARSRQ